MCSLAKFYKSLPYKCLFSHSGDNMIYDSEICFDNFLLFS